MNLVMSGLDYGLAPIALREQLSFTKNQVGGLNERICKAPGVVGCVLVSTCNRTELYLSCKAGEWINPAALLCAAAGADYGHFEHAFVTRTGEETVRHLMEVSGGLRSQIWGEDQILSQVKGAIGLARAHNAADPVLETLFRSAVAAGKEMKTKIRLRGVSVSAAAQAVEVLSQKAGDLAGKRALVIGNGEMGRLSACQLRDLGCAVTITLRTYHHGETVVPAGCAVIPYEERYRAMETAELVISATTSPHYTITVEELKPLSHIPPLMADLAIPRDIQPQVGELQGVRLYNVDTLGGGGDREIPPKAEALLREHMDRFYQWASYRASLPVLEQVKQAITQRVLTTDRLDELDQAELVELAVSRAVDLLAGGVQGLDAQRLTRCNDIIRTHTKAQRQNEREESSNERISISTLP